MEHGTDEALEILFVGNATLLIRYGPLTLLTDPNFLHQGQYAYLGHGLATRRLTEPALDASRIPPDLDGVVLSHLHGDHWDRVTRRHLDRTLPIITTPQAARRLSRFHGCRDTIGLHPWQQHALSREGRLVRVHAVPGRHALGPAARLLPPVMGSVLEFGEVGGPARLRLYITGDTLVFEGLREIARRFPDTDCAVVHLGGTTLPGGLVVTMDGAQGAELVSRTGPRAVLPVHYDDYAAFHSPLADFLHHVDGRGLGERVVRWAAGDRVVVTSSGTSHLTVAGASDGP
ncbi:MBL fold metallo-hydrolase [Streptomyces sp. NPDC059740]|uniref:MBL fold metallo-hydrolase n=1 Tax=Streptomyces sp. NPDC059740 TaxID=3346926 RepID=UPI0036465581